MDWFVKAFLKSSLGWLALGVTLGGAMAIHPQWIVYRPVHVHMNLLGFVTMMIYGVAYHVIPRFTGHALHSRRLAGAQWWLANIGLAVMAVGFTLRGAEGSSSRRRCSASAECCRQARRTGSSTTSGGPSTGLDS